MTDQRYSNALSGLGDALLRIVGRALEKEGKPQPDASVREFMTAVTTAFSAAAASGSVCIRLADAARVLADLRYGADPDDEADSTCVLARLDAVKPALSAGLDAFERLGLLQKAGSQKAAFSAAPFIYDDAVPDLAARLYIARFFKEEAALAANLLTIASAPVPPVSAEAQARLTRLADAFGAGDEQKAAVRKALAGSFSVICGGPGTGKTTTVVLILECLLADNPDLRIFLAAPTGKATSRMRQSIQNITSGAKGSFFPIMQAVNAADELKKPGSRTVEERTIHKWLVMNTPQGGRPSAQNPLAADVLIIDEASMVDVRLAARLFAAVSPRTRVIVLGDKYQLAAVGPGAVFADISDPAGRLAEHTVELRESRRFKDGSVIAALAEAVNHTGCASGDVTAPIVRKLLKQKTDGVSDYRVEWHAEAPDPMTGVSALAAAWLEKHLSDYVDALTRYLTVVKEAAAADDAGVTAARAALWDVLQRFRALCAQRHGPQSVEAVNAFAERFVRRHLAEIGELNEETDRLHYAGRVLIVRRNDDMLGVFNGDVGIVLPMPGVEGESRTTYFGDSGREIPPALLPEHDTAYAMTIHQSQGSEFRDVAVFLPVSPASGLATRELLYTGITRTSGTVAVFGRGDVLDAAVETPTERVSGLADRLRGR